MPPASLLLLCLRQPCVARGCWHCTSTLLLHRRWLVQKGRTDALAWARAVGLHPAKEEGEEEAAVPGAARASGTVAAAAGRPGPQQQQEQ